MKKYAPVPFLLVLGAAVWIAGCTGPGKPEAAPKAATAGPELCEEHGVPEDECGICHPELLAKKKPGETGMMVRLPTAASAAAAGVELAPSVAMRLEDGVPCLAELSFDQKRLAEITSPVPGTIASIEVDLGDRVRPGQVLARIASAATGEAQGDYLKALADRTLARKTFERQQRLRDGGIASDHDLQIAEAAWKSSEAAVQQSRQRLVVLGFTPRQLETLAAGEGASADLEIRAPFAGEVVDRTAVAGTLVEVGKPLLTVADTRTIWAMVDVPESQLGRVHVGQTVEITVDSMPGRTFHGRLTFLPPAVDERTRMARGRVEVPNGDGALRARMYARALIVTAQESHAVVVPRAAIQTIGGTTVVFVRSAADLYEARPVSLGVTRAGDVEIAVGLVEGEPVAVHGSFALKSQLLLSRLGAGCVD